MGMMINRRRACGGKSLPYDTEIEYLESSGTQWIDTGVYLNGGSEIRMRYKGFVNKMTAVGCRDSFQSRAFFITNSGTTGSSWGTWFVNYGYAHKMSSFRGNDGNVHTMVMNTVLTIDGIERTETKFPPATFQTTHTCCLFAASSVSSPQYYISTMVIYSAQLYNDGALVRDYIPVRVGQVGYMYDKVSGQLFGNSGTGSFILGPDI